MLQNFGDASRSLRTELGETRPHHSLVFCQILQTADSIDGSGRWVWTPDGTKSLTETPGSGGNRL